MRQQGMTQAELGAAIGLTQVQMSKSLKGDRRFTVREMDGLRRLLSEGDGATGAIPLRAIPVIGMVAAGNWREAIQQTRDYMPALDPSVPPRVFYLDVVGDSMDLLIPEGGRVLVDPDDKALFPNRYYVVENAEGETTFKQLKMDPMRLVPCSTNSAHQEIAIGEEPFSIVGRVLWTAARV